ncbi:hypothetical protein [Sphingomicrobium arenosum]|uniref:hypothetical protein n=1 Tax=Sphingomicrobium arenosum TaxID=2233861 RepID=UPI0022409E41|nr:hypothetical protein [Sphingomicrobium arenosum]
MPDPRLLFLPVILAACTELPSEDEGGTIGYDQPAAIAPELQLSTEINDLSDRSALAAHEGRYGVSAADCDPDNRYMTEYIDVTDVGFAYRGSLNTLHSIDGEARFTFSSPGGARETLAFQRGSLLRWPDNRAKRTTYQRCA